MEVVWLMRMEPYDDVFILRKRTTSAILKALTYCGYISFDDAAKYSGCSCDELEEVFDLYFESTKIYE